MVPTNGCLHLVVVVGLACSNEPESLAGGSVIAGRVSQAGQVEGEVPDKVRHSGPPGWGLGVRLTTPTP
jgi:hypothetical protein